MKNTGRIIINKTVSNLFSQGRPLNIYVDPFGTAIMIDAKHQCMTTRGINKPNVSTVTTKFSGLFAEDAELRNRFMQLVKE